ncbi:MAG: hypothetical protein DI636_10600 [Pelagerythrobacter marensis]|nr:MAG: hypothetical protein DI636_10600 [Pelagerythrobacter marensis]
MVEEDGSIRIAVDAWRPSRDYIDAYDAAPASFETAYVEWVRKAGGVPAFYLDTADWLHRKGQAARAREVLLSALDLPTADHATIGAVAARLERWGGAADLAVRLRERQAQLDPDRPQPRRLLALALAERARSHPATARADLERAIALLTEVALTNTDPRWDGIEVIALREANALIPRLRALGGEVRLDQRLIANLDSDVRVVIEWDRDATDIDLWVEQPNGETAIYSYPHTLIGGRLSNDMTNGFGPEEYWLRRAPGGSYKIKANVFASDRLDPNGSSRLRARLIRDFGRPTEREEAIDFDLNAGTARTLDVGTIRIEGGVRAEPVPPRRGK